MFDVSFNNGIIRKYTAAFGTLFNDIHITRENEEGESIQAFKIPLTYGSKEKFIMRVESDPNVDRNIAITLPRMSFSLQSVTYSPERKLNSVIKERAVDPNNPDNVLFQYMNVPYDLEYSLSILSKNIEDATRIIEQILPYFTPEFTVSIELIPDVNIIKDIPIELQGAILQEQYEGPFEERRVVVYDLQFIMRGYFFGPVKSGKIIKQVDLNYFSNINLDSEVQISTSTIPGLTANGTPTSNVNQTIDKSEITENDNYGIIKEFNKDI